MVHIIKSPESQYKILNVVLKHINAKYYEYSNKYIVRINTKKIGKTIKS